MAKINLSSSPPEISRTVKEESDKASRWYYKKLGGEQKASLAVRQCIEKEPKDRLVLGHGPVVEYNPPSGNTWLSTHLYHRAPGGVGTLWGVASVMYWTTEGSIGVFEPVYMKVGSRTECVVFVYTSHFFQRYHERMGGIDPSDKENAKELVTDFVAKNQGNAVDIQYDAASGDNLDDDDVMTRLNGCIGFGKRISLDPLVIEIRTVIPDEILTPNQLKRTEDIRKQYADYMDSEYTLTEEEKEDAHKHEISNEFTLKFTPLFKKCFAVSKYTEDIDGVCGMSNTLRMYVNAAEAYTRITGRKVEITDLHIDEFTIEQFLKLAVKVNKTSKMDAVSFVRIMAEELTKIAWHNSIDITLEDMYNDVLDHVSDSVLARLENQNKSNSMNQQSITQFKNLLSMTGLTKKFKTYSSAIDDNDRRYMENAESIYVISRFVDSIDNVKDKEKFINANKQWVALVVENGWCSELAPYIKEYGKDMTVKAIHWLMDNNMWVSPEGKKALKVKLPTNFAGLEDIHSAVDAIRAKAETAEEAHEEPSTQAPDPVKRPEPMEVFDSEETSEQVSVNEVAEELQAARRSAETILAAVELLNQGADNIKKYLAHDDLSSMFDEENSNLRKQVADLKAQIADMNKYHDKEVRDLTDQIKTSQDKLHREEKNRKAAEENAYLARQERKQAMEERDKISIDLSKANESLAQLQEMAKGADVQKCKILPFSKLNDLYGFGPGTIKMLREFLRGYNIFFDDERKK